MRRSAPDQDVAVAALTHDRHVGRLYELTGPRLLTFADAADEIAQASGREVRYVPVSLEEHAAEAAAHGVPSEVVELLTDLFSEVVVGRNAATTDGVRRARPGAAGPQRLCARRRCHWRLERLGRHLSRRGDGQASRRTDRSATRR
jgi:uncharacterized protein YbjT (DUF2867 family)